MTATTALVRRKTLVLNADYRPLSTAPLSLISAQDAIKSVVLNKVDVVEEWDEACHSPSLTMPIPKVVALRHYAPVSQEPKFCRHSIFLRDRFRCQYCGERFSASELTFDHVIPRERGGLTTWDNILAACVACNQRKRNHLPNYSGRRGKVKDGALRPLKEPRRPSTAELLRAGLEFLDQGLLDDYASWLYWSSELKA